VNVFTEVDVQYLNVLLLQVEFDSVRCVQMQRRQIVSTLVDSEKCYVDSLRRLCEVRTLCCPFLIAGRGPAYSGPQC